MKRKFDLEKTVYAVAAIAFFFLLWWFLTTFTPVKETTPGPIEVLQLLVSSFYTPIGNKVIRSGPQARRAYVDQLILGLQINQFIQIIKSPLLIQGCI